MRVFDLNKYARHGGRTPIKERGIKWEEAYEERSAPLKKRFDKQIGPGAYYRWEGHDVTTNSDYYVVVGPSIQKNVGKMFFAGVKKLPPEAERKEKKSYSPYGEYFPSMKAALAYANDKWGTPVPKGAPEYKKDQLAHVDIPEHVKA
tara:strand:+ start:252785 stop:253225 length:441 start_codon:yes stop_codon:yes gene_type:complete